MKFLFLLVALFTFVFPSDFYDNYGCNTRGKSKCCWVHYSSCCEPAEGKRTCIYEKTLCCKHRQYSMEDGEYVYTYTRESN